MKGLEKKTKSLSGGVVITGGVALVILVIAGLLLSMTPQLIQPTTHLEKFTTYDQLVAAFANNNNRNSGMNYVQDMIAGAVAPTMAANEAKSASTSTGSNITATDYSKTNVQVQGVDEADIIKNDGKYIYAISGGKVFIVDAYPAEGAKIISTIDLNGPTPTELFLSSDSSKLLIFTNNGGYYYPMYYAANVKVTGASSGSSVMPIRNWGSSAIVYDISDKTNPTVVKQLDFEGSYLNSRLIGDNAYFVINSYPHYPILCGSAPNEGACPNGSDENNIIPIMAINGTEQRLDTVTNIGIMPRVPAQSFVTIASINLGNLNVEKETVVGSANNIYASANNLFLAQTTYDYPNTTAGGEVVNAATTAAKVVVGMPIRYNPPTENVVITKFHLEEGKATFIGTGVAPGHILNQFSMDEYNNNFRIATTVDKQAVGPSGEMDRTTSNNVYILGPDMNMVGSIEGIAPNETIYSARFIGDKGYLVTFKRVDPLFVLDLSNPIAPKILGKLKIPGYSDYLQPIDETHLLGIGKDVNESIDAEKVHIVGGVYYTAILGVKMAIFDVSDVEHPVEMYNYTIGARGSDSEALTEHKAILFDAQKNLLVLPMTIVSDVANGEANGEQTFQGAVVMNVSLDNGFSERGRITHVTPEEELKRGYYYDTTSQIRRSLFLDNVLYTFSESMLKANALDTLAEISDVNFPQSQNNYNTYYGGGVAQPMMVE